MITKIGSAIILFISIMLFVCDVTRDEDADEFSFSMMVVTCSIVIAIISFILVVL